MFGVGGEDPYREAPSGVSTEDHGPSRLRRAVAAWPQPKRPEEGHSPAALAEALSGGAWPRSSVSAWGSSASQPSFLAKAVKPRIPVLSPALLRRWSGGLERGEEEGWWEVEGRWGRRWGQRGRRRGLGRRRRQQWEGEGSSSGRAGGEVETSAPSWQAGRLHLPRSGWFPRSLQPSSSCRHSR